MSTAACYQWLCYVQKCPPASFHVEPVVDPVGVFPISSIAPASLSNISCSSLSHRSAISSTKGRATIGPSQPVLIFLVACHRKQQLRSPGREPAKRYNAEDGRKRTLCQDLVAHHGELLLQIAQEIVNRLGEFARRVRWSRWVLGGGIDSGHRRVGGTVVTATAVARGGCLLRLGMRWRRCQGTWWCQVGGLTSAGGSLGSAFVSHRGWGDCIRRATYHVAVVFLHPIRSMCLRGCEAGEMQAPGLDQRFLGCLEVHSGYETASVNGHPACDARAQRITSESANCKTTRSEYLGRKRVLGTSYSNVERIFSSDTCSLSKIVGSGIIRFLVRPDDFTQCWKPFFGVSSPIIFSNRKAQFF